MAISATEIFRRHAECYDEEASDRFRHGQPSTPLADSLLMQTGHPERIFLVRGEEETTQTFSQQLTDTQVIMPKLHEEFTL